MFENKDSLIAKYVSGNSTPEEERIVLDWARENESHQHELNKAKEIWNSSGILKKTETPFDPDKAWAEFLQLKDNPIQKSLTKPWLSPMKMVAGIIILAMVGFISQLSLFKTNEKAPTNRFIAPPILTVNMVTVYAGDSAKVFFLPDSSRIFLNANSSLQYPEQFKSGTRNTYLNGEAFFEVRHDTTKPFLVFCGETQTKVLGTSFNIKGYKDKKDIEISVVTGRVEVSDIKKTATPGIVLFPKDKAVFNTKSASFTKTKHNDKEVKWREKNTLGKRIKKMIRKIKQKMNNK